MEPGRALGQLPPKKGCGRESSRPNSVLPVQLTRRKRADLNKSRIYMGCLRPLILPHSYINISEFGASFPVGTVVYYQCFPGYKLEGAEILECMYNLIWSDSPPRCLDVEVCPLPPMVSHGDYICHPRPCERYNHGTVVEFYCDPGYTLTNDYKYITCQYGEWFPSYQVYCVKTGKEESYPNGPVFLRSLILEQICRGNQEGSMGDPDFVVVDGVPVMLPSYDEAVSSGLSALAPGYSAAAEQGHILQTEDQNPPAYPGPRIPDTQPSEFETCDSRSGSSELLQSLYPSLTCPGAALPGPDRTDVSHSTDGDAASTSPRIDITDGDFHLPDICCKPHAAEKRQSRRFLECVEDNLAQLVSEPARGGTMLSLLFANRDGLVGDVVLGGQLGHSDHEIVEFSIFGETRGSIKKTPTLDSQRAEFGPFKRIIWRVPWEADLKNKVFHEG
ncbi:hypothetical protein DUI87_09862 [Hirundo rustica rustica]|uniref:Sushi domain-containing protein n=1 Tax=Hirundo rustica rustica TaxID=333673 RepID=A0A3M0KYY7_HIRRU|nr:hypothetical protein DUI87_09862 [Hirundo rustica rustica]